MSHVKGHKETKWERFKRRLRDNKKTRAEQFANYLNMVDSYSKKRVSLKGSMVQLGNLKASAGRGSMPNLTKMSTVMNKYHDKALRLAQAKYYQKQVG
jgi:hypothetical protein|tara:strand:- start:5950 stop:6243 length:294 start_codon:yes stop_codon:yes gene_type:complete